MSLPFFPDLYKLLKGVLNSLKNPEHLVHATMMKQSHVFCKQHVLIGEEEKEIKMAVSPCSSLRHLVRWLTWICWWRQLFHQVVELLLLLLLQVTLSCSSHYLDKKVHQHKPHDAVPYRGKGNIPFLHLKMFSCLRITRLSKNNTRKRTSQR